MSAILSDDRKYRYRLDREIEGEDPANVLGVIMINPSTADEETNDPTIRRLLGFAKNYGCGTLSVCNLFALRSPDVRDLKKDPDPVGPDNWRHLSILMEDSRQGRVVVAFGSYNKIPKLYMDCVPKLKDLADIHGTTLWTWGTNRDGSPKHPLYIPISKGLDPWL